MIRGQKFLIIGFCQCNSINFVEEHSAFYTLLSCGSVGHHIPDVTKNLSGTGDFCQAKRHSVTKTNPGQLFFEDAKIRYDNTKSIFVEKQGFKKTFRGVKSL